MGNDSTRGHAAGVVLGIALFGPACAAIVYAVLPVAPAIAQATFFGSRFLLGVLPLVWLWGIARRRPALPGPKCAGLVAGAAGGLIAAGAVGAAYYVLLADRIDPGVLRAKAESIGAGHHYVWFALFVAVINTALEEYYWRWFVFGLLKGRLPVLWAAIISALAFGLHHFVVLGVWFGINGLAVVLTLGVVAAGLFWALLYQRCRNWYAPWLSHLLADLGVMIVGHDLLFGN